MFYSALSQPHLQFISSYWPFLFDLWPVISSPDPQEEQETTTAAAADGGDDGDEDDSEEDSDDDSDDSDDDSDDSDDDDEGDEEEGEEEEEEEEIEEPLSLEWPDTPRKQATYLFLLPIVFPLWLTVPDVRNPVSTVLFSNSLVMSGTYTNTANYT